MPSLGRKKTEHIQQPQTFNIVRSYRRFKRFSILFSLLLALTPLMIMTVVTYHLDQKASSAENRYGISRIISSTKNMLELMVEERRSALTLIVNEQYFEGLNSEASLSSTFRNLKSSFGGFIDLGLIDSDGAQLFYSGPYNLKGRNYKDQSWFHEVNLRGVFVSDVFMGYRNFPHFVIAVKDEKQNGEFYVLRATIDMDLFKEQIFSQHLSRSTDVFIINKDGILQTSSAFSGGVLDKMNFEVSFPVRNLEVIEEFKKNGEWITFGYAHIKNTPFILIALKQHESPFGHWISRRSDLLWFLLFCVILILLFVYWRATYLVKRFREADQLRAKAFHNIEYTNKMATIGRMAASVAHEINNPLAIINEKAGLLKDIAEFSEDYPRKGKTIELVNSIHKSVDRCSAVTHRLLGFAKRMDVGKELIDLDHLMSEVAGFLGKEALHRNIDIKCNFPADFPAIESDRGQLQQIFLNILNNAFKAVEDGGKIDVSAAKREGDIVSIFISDNGSGIPEENLEHIFEPFYSTRGEFGTGLGLSITNDIVHKLGGEIEVESVIGEGTRFIVTLPIKKKEY